MQTNEHEQELRELFDGLRREDAAQAPPFARLIRPRHSEDAAPAFSFPWLRLLTGLSAAAALALVLVSQRTARKPSDNLTQWAALSNWRASTDSFLTASNSGWANTLNTTTDSWLENWSSSDSDTTQTIQEKTL